MTADEFNRYCAEVMGYSDTRLVCGDYGDFDPAADLNQMAEVFDKLVKNIHTDKDQCMSYNAWVNFLEDIEYLKIGIAQAMREFIESTKEE